MGYDARNIIGTDGEDSGGGAGDAADLSAPRRRRTDKQEGDEMRERPFRLVQLKRPVSHDVIRCLESMLENAKRGEVHGLAFVVMMENREFFYNACGEAHRNPAWAAAMAATLMHGTMKRVFNEEGA